MHNFTRSGKRELQIVIVRVQLAWGSKPYAGKPNHCGGNSYAASGAICSAGNKNESGEQEVFLSQLSNYSIAHFADFCSSFQTFISFCARVSCGDFGTSVGLDKHFPKPEFSPIMVQFENSLHAQTVVASEIASIPPIYLAGSSVLQALTSGACGSPSFAGGQFAV
jgi:hypothetical protein